jgi:carboxylate-amine ligase
VIEQAWGSSLTVGLEEEIFIVDAESLALAPAVETVIRGTEGRDLPGRIKTELFASVVELNTEARDRVADALESLQALRAAAAGAARANGFEVAATGAHPFSDPEEQEIAAEERYREFVDYAGSTARRQGVSGLHVHLGMESADACFHALESMLPWLPVVLALSANSPYLSGRETGLLSTRAEILGILPRRGAPPPFAGYDEWERFVERLTSTDAMRDYTTIWWDVRPHPRYGTLEVRMPDQPTELGRTGAFAALLQAFAATVLDEPPRVPDVGSRGIYDQNRWAASRFGPRAQLVHPERDGALDASELWRELRERVDPAVRRLGLTELLAPLDDAICEADRQLEVGRRDGLRAVCADVVARTRVAEAK